ncbi:unnamed protein product [Heterosigma akashiwo]
MAKDKVKDLYQHHSPEEKQTLQDQGIIKEEFAANKEKLSREMTKDKIGHLYKHHSPAEKKELQDKGILKDPIQSRAQKLEQAQTRDTLGYLLSARPEPEEVEPLLPERGLAPSLQPAGYQLEKNLKRGQLQRRLEGRPAQEGVASAGLLGEAGDTPVPPPHLAADTPPPRVDDRTHFAVALKTIAQMAALEIIDARGKAVLKELALDDDPRVRAAVRGFARTQDVVGLMGAFHGLLAAAAASSSSS